MVMFTDEKQIDNPEDYIGEHVNMCEGVKGMLAMKSAEVSKAIWAVIKAIRNDWSDSDIREKYGVDQDVIDQTRAAMQGG